MAPGSVNFWLRAGSRIDWRVDLDVTDPAAAEAWRRSRTPDRSLGELHFEFLGRSITVPAYRLRNDGGFVPAGNGRFSSAPPPVRVIAHWVNLPELRGQTLLGVSRPDGRQHNWRGRWEIDLGPGHVLIDSRDDLERVDRGSNRRGGSRCQQGET
jgi:hypothetical protein